MPRSVGSLALAFVLAVLAVPVTSADHSEVWVVDQADAANGGDRLYVYTTIFSADVAAGRIPTPEVIELGARAQGVGDGAGVRPHLLLFNSAQTHGVLANVASGHVYVIRVSDRSVVASIDVGAQAHGAMPSPDDRWILVANQNGKRLARIQSDFVNERFTYDPAADLDLGALEDAEHPDNAPICPVMYVGTRGKAYVTLRGGGMYIVDTAATPMAVIRSYGRSDIAPAGCGGISVDRRVYVNSGSETSGALYAFDPQSDALLARIDTTAWGTDAHGMAYLGNGYLWMANRGDGDNIIIIDLRTMQVVSSIDDVGQAPDLLDVDPAGDVVYVTLRGPNPLTGAHPATGQTPGVAVIQVEDGGASGRRIGFWPIGDQSPQSPVDPHAIAIRATRSSRGPDFLR